MGIFESHAHYDDEAFNEDRRELLKEFPEKGIEHGKYVGTITEGDLLWKMADENISTFEEAEEIPISDIHRRVNNRPVNAEAHMESLIDLAIKQNFVPVVDDDNVFIGIVTRKDIIQYLYKNYDKQAM